MDLEEAWPQMSRQLELPLGDRGEAPMVQRSEEASTAVYGDGHSGTLLLGGVVLSSLRYLNLRNRPVRTRTPGGVGGVLRIRPEAPIPLGRDA